MVATENKLPKLSTLDFGICRTEREGGVVSKLDCSSRKVPESICNLTFFKKRDVKNNKLTSEFPRTFLALPEPSTQ